MLFKDVLLLLLLVVVVSGAPKVRRVQEKEEKLERYLDSFLDLYWTLRLSGDGEDAARLQEDSEEMQGDQPLPDSNSIGPPSNSQADFQKMARERDRNEWKQRLKSTILQTTGRSNSTMSSNGGKIPIDLSKILNSFPKGLGNLSGEFNAAEKLMSFYPTCEVPKNLDHEVKKDDNIMNLYISPDQLQANISTATLRLYRANVTEAPVSCEEDEKLYRVTIYFYTKSRKHRVKKKMCESKMVSIHSKWAELNVKPAIAAWTEGKNLGLAIQVEDQEGKVVRADSFFRGCIVGTSTPIPIPTMFLDAAGHHDTIPQLPTIDICIVELPENHTRSASARDRGCDRLPPPSNLRHQHSRGQHAPSAPPAKQRQPPAPAAGDAPADPRSQISQHRVVLTNQQLRGLNVNISELEIAGR